MKALYLHSMTTAAKALQGRRVLWMPHTAIHMYTGTTLDTLTPAVVHTHAPAPVWGSLPGAHPQPLFTQYEAPNTQIKGHSAFVNSRNPDLWHPLGSKVFRQYGHKVLDVYEMSESRPDQHVCAAVERSSDCLHYCAGGLYSMIAVELQLDLQERFAAAHLPPAAAGPRQISSRGKGKGQGKG